MDQGQHGKTGLPCCPLDGSVDIAGMSNGIFVHYVLKCVESVKNVIAK